MRLFLEPFNLRVSQYMLSYWEKKAKHDKESKGGKHFPIILLQVNQKT